MTFLLHVIPSRRLVSLFPSSLTLGGHTGKCPKGQPRPLSTRWDRMLSKHFHVYYPSIHTTLRIKFISVGQMGKLKVRKAVWPT